MHFRLPDRVVAADLVDYSPINWSTAAAAVVAIVVSAIAAAVVAPVAVIAFSSVDKV